MSDAEGLDPFDGHSAAVDRPLVRLFREYGRAHLRWFVLGVVSNVLGLATSLVAPLVLGVTIDAVFRGEAAYTLPLVPRAWIPDGQLAQLQLSLALVGVALLATGLFTWAQGLASDVFAHRVLHEVRVDTYARMQRLDMRFFDDAETGELMSILNNDATNLETFLDDAMKTGIRIVVLVALIAGTLLWLHWQLAIVTLVAVPLMVWFTWWFTRRVEPLYAAVRESVGALNTRLENSLAGMEVVKTSATESFESDRVRSASRQFYEDNIAALKLSFLYRPGMKLLAGVGFLATFGVGGVWLVRGPPPGFSGRLRLGTFVTFLFLTQRFVDPLAEVGNVVDWYENANASGKRIFGLLDVDGDVTEAADAVDLNGPDGHVTYEGITFAYEDDARPVLEGVTLEAAPGETVGIAGPTGAGKSTLLKLLPRLYDVTEGAVRIDTTDIREVTLSSLRGAIGYVGQDAFLFDGTVAENIRYGRFDADERAVREAAERAEAGAFIEDLPDGYETRVGERGVKLSGGQRQRISIARTILQDPDILVFDEATSSVDTETEMLIQRSLTRLAADRTTFVIAHRLSTIKDADTILVLDDGEIVERGTHEALLERDGLYANLWGVQTGEVEDLPEAFRRRVARRDAT